MSKREKEVKLLAVSAEQLAAIGRLPSLGGAPLGAATVREQEDVYLDTDDFRLFRAGVSFRYRRARGRVTATLKEISPAGSRPLLRDRSEEEEEIPELPARVTDLPPGALGERLRPLLGGRDLTPVAQLRTSREKRILGMDGAPAAELCLDRVELRETGASRPHAAFFEVEIEDRGGGEGLLSRAGEELLSAHALVPSTLSKFERALAANGLLAHARGEDRSFDTVVIHDDRVVDAGYRVFRKHFERILANEPGTRLGEDAEFLHDMRVSTRRIRAAFRVFRPAFPERTLGGHNRNLRRVARVLGEVRDLDVYLERLPEYAKMLPEEDRSALEPFARHLRRRRVRARDRMLRYLDSRSYAAFLDRFDRFLVRGAPKRPGLPEARRPVAEFAPERIGKALKRVLRDGRRIPGKNPPPEALHRLRIQVKRLRYSCEFFSDLYGKPLRRFVKTTVMLQDLLGAHQDSCIAGDSLRAFAARLPAGRRESVRTALALGRLIASQDLAAAAARHRFRKVFRAFDTAKARSRMFGA